MTEWQPYQYRGRWGVGYDTPNGWCVIVNNLDKEEAYLFAYSRDMYQVLKLCHNYGWDTAKCKAAIQQVIQQVEARTENCTNGGKSEPEPNQKEIP